MMNYLKILLPLIFYAGNVLCFEISADVIEGYFNSYNVNVITLLICSEEAVKYKLLKHMSQNGFSVSFTFEPLLGLTERRSGVLLDLNCDLSSTFVNELSKNKAIAVDKELLLLDKVNDTETFQVTDGVEMLMDAYILPGSCVTLAQHGAYQVSYYDVYRISEFTPLKYHLLARQGSEHFLALPPRPSRDDFEGVVLTTAGVLFRPQLFLGYDSYDNLQVDAPPKVSYPVVKTLSEQLNFSMSLRILNDYGWKINGNYTQLIGLLQAGKIDLTASGIYTIAERTKYVDLVGEIFNFKSRLIFRKPSLSSVSNIYTLPFERNVWICCCALSVLTTLLLVLDKFCSVGQRRAFYKIVTTSDITTAVIGCISQQGYEVNPKSGSAKATIFLFSMSTLIFYTSYSANIVTLLQSTSSKLKTLDDLTNSPLRAGVMDTLYYKYYLADRSDASLDNFYKKKIVPEGDKAFLLPKYGIKNVREGLYAFMVETQWGYKIVSDTFLESEKCSLGEMFMLYIPKLALAVVKKSGYKEILTVKNLLQRDVGLLNRIYERWFTKKPHCASTGRGFVSVGIVDLKSSFYIMTYGFIISGLIFIIEIVYNKSSKSVNRFSICDYCKIRSE